MALPEINQSADPLEFLSDEELDVYASGSPEQVSQLETKARERALQYGQVKGPQDDLATMNRGMLWTAENVAAPIALSAGGGMLGATGAASLGAGRAGVAAGALAGDVAANYLYDKVRGAENPELAALANTALSGGTLMAGGAVRALMPSQRVSTVAQASDPSSFSGLFAKKGGSNEAIANVRQLGAVQDDLIGRGFYNKVGGEYTNYVNPETLRMEVSDDASKLLPGQSLRSPLDPTVRSYPATIKATATSPEALKPLVDSRDSFVSSIEEAFHAARANPDSAVGPIPGVRPETLFSQELQEKISRWGSSSFTEAKAELADATRREVLKDLVKGKVDDPDGMFSWMQFVTENVRTTPSGRTTVTLEQLGELSPAKAQQLYQSAQEFLRDAGSFDLKNLSAVLAGNRANITPAVELSQEVARDLVKNLGPEISKLEGRVRGAVADQGWLFPELTQSIMSKPDNYIYNANQTYHSLATAHRTMAREAERVHGVFEGQTMNADPTISMYNKVAGRAGEYLYPQEARRAAQSRETFNRAALLADIRLNPDRYSAGGSLNVAKAALATTVPEVAQGAMMLAMSSMGRQEPALTSDTNKIMDNPRQAGMEAFERLNMAGLGNVGFMIGSELVRIAESPMLPEAEKKRQITQVLMTAPGVLPKTPEGYSGVVDNKFVIPLEQAEHTRAALSRGGSLMEEASIVGSALRGDYSPLAGPRMPQVEVQRRVYDDIDITAVDAAFDVTPPAKMSGADPESEFRNLVGN